MKKIALFILSLGSIFFLTGSISKERNADIADVCISMEEQKLYTLIMEYRTKYDLPKIPLSRSLTYVAQVHCKDLYENKPDLKEQCNAHSWSSKGKWTPCCYTADHKQAECMWNKPKELTSYTGNGFEIAAGSSKPMYNNSGPMTAEVALKGWKESVHHNDVILNNNIWKEEWNAIGVGIYKGYSVVWFGNAVDKEKQPLVCK